MKRIPVVAVLSMLALLPFGLWANPIPVPPPASLPLEAMTITIGADRHVDFTGTFTFNSIPTTVTKMQFPLPPVNASNVQVWQDGVGLSWNMSMDMYPTVLPEYPSLSMFEWAGPFPESGAVFTVDYEHDLFPRGDDWVFFYSLGTGKYFPTYDKVTKAIFDIYLPSTAMLKAVLLDNTPVDPSLYTLTGSHLVMTLTSEYGPFTKDLILVMSVPEPATLGLFGVGLLGMMGRLRRRVLPVAVAAVLATVAGPVSLAAGQCDFRQVFTRPDENGTTTVKVYQARAVTLPNGKRPLLFITSLKVNTDGARISYHQDDPTGRRCATDPNATPCAINNIRNAYRDRHRPESEFIALRDQGYPLPRTWQLLNPDIIEKNASTGKPCLTPDGYLVSMTADVAVAGGWNRVGDCDPSKWIDALTIPAIVLPKKTSAMPSQFLAQGVQKRSVVVAVSHRPSHRVVAGIVGDYGPPKEIGEASIALNRALNGLPDGEQPQHRQDAINRFQAGRTAILLFPGSEFVLDRPISKARIDTVGSDALTKFGGAQKLVDCIHDEVDPTF